MSAFVQVRAHDSRARLVSGVLVAAVCMALAIVIGATCGVSRAFAYNNPEPNYGSYYGASENGGNAISPVAGLTGEVEEDDSYNDGSGSEEESGEPEGILEKAQLAGSTSVDNNPDNVLDPAQRADNSFIYDTTIGALAQELSFNDGQTVQVTGEVIGDRIATGTDGYSWITVEAEDPTDSSTISVYMSDTLADQIDEYGRYGVIGSRIQVRGVYNQACKEHDGLSDIHATSVEVTAAGVHNPDEFDINKFISGAVLIAIGLGMIVAFSIVRERSR